MSGSNREAPSSRFLFPDAQDFLTPVGLAINDDFLGDEEALVRSLADIARLDSAQHDEVQATARKLVEAVRKAPAAKTGLDAFLRQYDLSSQEGVILMCLAEALLRIPDDETADRLIADKLRGGDWASHLGDSQSLFVNASTWGLMLDGPHRAARSERRRCARQRDESRRRPRRRARRAHRDAPGHAHHGPPVRDGAHDEGGARQFAERRQPALSLHVRHAGRGGADHGRCHPLLRCLPHGHRRACRAGQRIPGLRIAPEHLREALRDASALRAFAPPARASRTHAAAGRAVPAGARCGHRADARYRRVRAARTDDGTAGGRLPRSVARRLERLRHRGADLPEARAADAEVHRRPGAGDEPHPARAPREGRLLGRRDQAWPGARPAGLPAVHAQAQHRRVVPGVRALRVRPGQGRAVPAVRDPQRAYRGGRRQHGEEGRVRVRVPAPARHG